MLFQREVEHIKAEAEKKTKENQKFIRDALESFSQQTYTVKTLLMTFKNAKFDAKGTLTSYEVEYDRSVLKNDAILIKTVVQTRELAFTYWINALTQAANAIKNKEIKEFKDAVIEEGEISEEEVAEFIKHKAA